MIHFCNNPEVLKGLAVGRTAMSVRNAYKWSFLHWDLGAWACYALVVLALAFFFYLRDLPLIMRSGLTPLLGNVVDIIAVVAIILGVAQALSIGVEKFTLSLYRIGVGDWFLQTNETGKSITSKEAVAETA